MRALQGGSPSEERTAPLSLALAACLVALAVAACDRGGRERAPMEPDAGSPDADADTDTDTDDDTDDDDWRFDDIGDYWDDGTMEITGPCDGDCSYVYRLTYIEWSDNAGQSRFEIRPGPVAGTVAAVGLDSYRYILWYSWPNYALYRQRLLSEWVLRADDHELVSLDATVYNAWGGVDRLKRYEISWDEAANQLAAVVTSGGRTWTRALPAERAPLVMFNLREFPLQGFGNHSSLFAFLLGRRYDWDTGGTQWIEVFSPEQERLDRVAVSRADADDTLLLHYPVDLARPLWRSSSDPEVTLDRNSVEIEYAHGIPVRIGTCAPYQLRVFSAPPFELNLAEQAPGELLETPEVVGGYDSEELLVETGDAALAGIVDRPPDGGPHPAVVMLPGWDHVTRQGEVGAVDLFFQLADRLAAAGFLVARFDARGAGLSTGALEDTLLPELVADGMALVEEVWDLPSVDRDRVFLLARGDGARVAAAVAADPESGAAGVILLAPSAGAHAAEADDILLHYLGSFAFHGQYLNEQQHREIALQESLADGSYEGEYCRGHSVEAWQSMMHVDWVADAVLLPPVLLARGAEDILFDEPRMAALGDALGAAGTEVTRVEFEGLSHALTPGTREGGWPEHGSAEAVDPAAAQALIDWLEERTGGGL